MRIVKPGVQERDENKQNHLQFFMGKNPSLVLSSIDLQPILYLLTCHCIDIRDTTKKHFSN